RLHPSDRASALAHRLAAELQEERVGVNCYHARSRQHVHYTRCQRARPGAQIEHVWRRADHLADQPDHHPKALLALGPIVALLSLPPSQPRSPVNNHCATPQLARPAEPGWWHPRSALRLHLAPAQYRRGAHLRSVLLDEVECSASTARTR